MDKIDRPDLMRRVRDALSYSPAVVLIGPRQVGKTTLARAIAEETGGQGHETLVLDLERFDDLRKLDDARAFLELRIGKLTVIDEVHRTPRLFEELRGLIPKLKKADSLGFPWRADHDSMLPHDGGEYGEGTGFAGGLRCECVAAIGEGKQERGSDAQTVSIGGNLRWEFAGRSG